MLSTLSRAAPAAATSRPSTWTRTPISMSVAVRTAWLSEASSFTCCTMAFGLRAGATAAAVRKAASIFSRSTVAFIRQSPCIRSSRCLLKQTFLPHPLGGDLAVAFFDLDADGFAAQVFGGAKRGAGAHEGVEDGHVLSLPCFVRVGDRELHERHRLLGRVLSPFLVCFSPTQVTHARCRAEARPRKLGVSKRKIPLHLI